MKQARGRGGEQSLSCGRQGAVAAYGRAGTRAGAQYGVNNHHDDAQQYGGIAGLWGSLRRWRIRTGYEMI
jgi:hypothetical protein